jgi:hypothetical protein
MLMENSVWTFKAFNVQCKPDDVERTENDADMPVTQDDDVGVSQPTHRRSLGAAFDLAGTKSRLGHEAIQMAGLITDPEFTCEPDEAAFISDSLAKLQSFINNVQTHREMSENMSRNSKMENGAVGMANLQNLPVRGAKGDTTLRRKRGFHEKFLDERKRKESKGKRQTRLQ